MNENDLKLFRSVLGESGVLTDANEIQPFNVDWMGKYKGDNDLYLRIYVELLFVNKQQKRFGKCCVETKNDCSSFANFTPLQREKVIFI